jgi:hypothetical protein
MVWGTNHQPRTVVTVVSLSESGEIKFHKEEERQVDDNELYYYNRPCVDARSKMLDQGILLVLPEKERALLLSEDGELLDLKINE